MEARRRFHSPSSVEPVLIHATAAGLRGPSSGIDSIAAPWRRR